MQGSDQWAATVSLLGRAPLTDSAERTSKWWKWPTRDTSASREEEDGEASGSEEITSITGDAAEAWNGKEGEVTEADRRQRGRATIYFVRTFMCPTCRSGSVCTLNPQRMMAAREMEARRS